ncbi:MAG TPA: TetR/AcrR family transcriptional regulator [Candidatus Krumholzibacteria bacterium]|jgi:AcrR family transcriptional regulator
MSKSSAFENDPKAQGILAAAAKVFSEKGYHHASMRDIAKEAGTSLAGMYYYFPSKEDMLFSIQTYCFRAVLDRLEQRIAESVDPHERLRAFIHNHLSFFITNVREMRVLSHESESLTGDYRAPILELKRAYYQSLEEILRAIAGTDWDEPTARRNVLSVFGMVNWIYTWYDPQRDGTAEALGDQMYALICNGIAAAHS